MPYTPLYTTVEAIALRLRGRLLTESDGSFFAPTVVDTDLIYQVLEQVEARINAKLTGRYQLPLKSVHPVLASIAEKLVICDLMATHFIDTGNNEPGGFGRLMCSQGAAELEDILSGAIALDGEATTGGSVGTIASYTRIALRNPGIAEGVKW